ncbi:MAG: SET domain-containing protein-lysine N-methyltransferase [Ferruginibacter sp.]
MISTAITNPSIKIISQHVFAEIIQNTETSQNSLHAIVSFKKGALISTFSAGDTFSTPNYLTVQKGINEHITLLPQFLQYINHSCDPNVFFDTTSMEVIALKDIQPNEEFSFFYPSTELDMAQPFLCYCGSRSCLQNIKGAKYIPGKILKKYRLTDFIQQQLQHKL